MDDQRKAYRMTEAGPLLLALVFALVVSFFIMKGTLAWDSGSVVCYYLFTQAFTSLILGGVSLLLVLTDAEYYAPPFPPLVVFLSVIFALPALVVIGIREFMQAVIEEAD